MQCYSHELRIHEHGFLKNIWFLILKGFLFKSSQITKAIKKILSKNYKLSINFWNLWNPQNINHILIIFLFRLFIPYQQKKSTKPKPKHKKYIIRNDNRIHYSQNNNFLIIFANLIFYWMRVLYFIITRKKNSYRNWNKKKSSTISIWWI